MTEKHSPHLPPPTLLGSVICAARCAAGLSQTEVADQLKISQGYLSKLENNQIGPDAVLWFNFCDLVHIPYESLRTGYIDFMSPAQLRQDPLENGFRLPKPYALNRGTKVRSLLPLLASFRKEQGDHHWNRFLKDHKLSPEFFVLLDSQIHLRFAFDLLQEMAPSRSSSSATLNRWVDSVSLPQSHGQLQNSYDQARNSLQLIEKLIRHAHQYDCDFQYELSTPRANSVGLTVRPEPHVEELMKTHPVFGKGLFCEYRKKYLEKFSTYRGMPGLKVNHDRCVAHGDSHCHFQLSQSTA